MPSLVIMWISIIFFIFAAAFGVSLLRSHLKKGEAPVSGALVHGAFATTGLVLLLVAIFFDADGTLADLGAWPTIAAAIFGAVAAGGAVMFTMHALGKPLLKPLALLHALGAAIGIGLLLFVMVGRLITTEPIPLDVTDMEPDEIDEPSNIIGPPGAEDRPLSPE